MSKPDFDIATAKRLVDEIAANLSAIPASSPKHAELRGEVEQLQGLLAAAEKPSPSIEAGMHSVHSLTDRASAELQADGIQVGMFLRDIGRMLGLD